MPEVETATIYVLRNDTEFRPPPHQLLIFISEARLVCSVPDGASVFYPEMIRYFKNVKQ